MKTVQEAMQAFEIAALNAGLARNTRSTYASILNEFVTLMKRSAERNVIPIRRTA